MSVHPSHPSQTGRVRPEWSRVRRTSLATFQRDHTGPVYTRQRLRYGSSRGGVRDPDRGRDIQPSREPVGAENPVTSCDLHILVYEAAEPISSQRPDGALEVEGLGPLGGC